MNNHYYEVSYQNEIVAFDTLENAIEYADNNNCVLISEIGGSFNDYEKCWFCDDWYTSNELNRNGLCCRCEIATLQHGG